jgi:hypothetical protein
MIVSLLQPQSRRTARALYIESFTFPASIESKLKETHPALSHADTALVLRGLRDWFQVCLVARGHFVSMPSRVVDDAWHAFILDTEVYERFCREAFGRFLHHKPVEKGRPATMASAGMHRTWRHANGLMHQDPYRPEKLPLLFGIDAQLQIPNGQHYTLDWARRERDARRAASLAGLTGGCSAGAPGSCLGSSSGSSCSGSSCSANSCGSSCGSGCGGGGS